MDKLWTRTADSVEAILERDGGIVEVGLDGAGWNGGDGNLGGGTGEDVLGRAIDGVEDSEGQLGGHERRETTYTDLDHVQHHCL